MMIKTFASIANPSTPLRYYNIYFVFSIICLTPIGSARLFTTNEADINHV